MPGASAEQTIINKSEPRKVVEATEPVDNPKPASTVKRVEKKTSAPEPKAKEKAQVITPKPVSAGSCEETIAKIWPAALQSGARIVSTKESSMISDRIGPLKADGTVGYNYDGSRDYGCFQINDKAHPTFFANGDWRDPIYNAQYALKIYNERGNWTAWYAVRGILW